MPSHRQGARHALKAHLNRKKPLLVRVILDQVESAIPKVCRGFETQYSPSAVSLDAKSRPSPSVSPSEGNLPNEDLPQGSVEEETLVSSTDDDVDATDYKNMPNYDPDQEESLYDSTPSPETETTTSPTKKRSFGDASYVRRYVRLHSDETSSGGEVSGMKTSYLPNVNRDLLHRS